MKLAEETEKISTIRNILIEDGRIKFAYLFGSQAEKKNAPLSDTDIAVYLDVRIDYFAYRLKLMETLAKKLKEENFDLIVLNTAPTLLKYEVIKSNYVLKDDKRRRISFEIKVLQEYLDTSYLRQTQRQIMQEKIRKEEYFG
jgi:predicted nucleotidyltransferase